MSEAAVVEAPPAQSQSVGGPTATSLFAQQMADLAAKETDAAPEAAPEVTPEPKAKPATVKEETAEAPKEAAPKVDDKAWLTKKIDQMTGDEVLKLIGEKPSKAFKVHEFAKGKYEAKIAELEKKIGEVNAKPQTPANDARIEAYEKQIKDYTEQLSGRDKTIAELDYTKSPQFKRDYIDPYNSAKQAAHNEIKQLTVTDGDITRAATPEDFDTLFDAPLRIQRQMAKAMFGENSDVFFTHRNTLLQIKRSAMDATAKKGEEFQESKTQSEIKTKEEGRLYETQLEARHVELVDQFPELFGDTDNQEASTAFQKGLDFAKHALSERMKMSPAERAEHDALLIQTHAGFRRLAIESKAKDSEIETLKKELAKYRKSDPGSAGDGKATPIVDNGELGGIAGMASAYKK